MEIKNSEYSVYFDEPNKTIVLEGAFRLGGPESYEPISALLDEVAQKGHVALTLDVRRVEYLNSSGINMLSKFTITVRGKGNIALTVRGNKEFPWQAKSLQNLKRLYTSLELIVD